MSGGGEVGGHAGSTNAALGGRDDRIGDAVSLAGFGPACRLWDPVSLPPPAVPRHKDLGAPAWQSTSCVAAGFPPCGPPLPGGSARRAAAWRSKGAAAAGTPHAASIRNVASLLSAFFGLGVAEVLSASHNPQPHTPPQLTSPVSHCQPHHRHVWSCVGHTGGSEQECLARHNPQRRAHLARMGWPSVRAACTPGRAGAGPPSAASRPSRTQHQPPGRWRHCHGTGRTMGARANIRRHHRVNQHMPSPHVHVCCKLTRRSVAPCCSDPSNHHPDNRSSPAPPARPPARPLAGPPRR